jgi:class 3 adenylate cyclase
MKKFIDYFIPESYNREEEAYRKASTLVWTLVVMYLFTMNYVATSFFIGYDMGMWTEFIGSFVYIGMFFLFKNTGNIKLVSNITIGCATICIAICAWFSGGYHSGVFPWLAFPAIVVMLISDKNSGWFWLAINVAIVLTFSVLDINGYVFTEDYNLEFKGLFEIICYVGLVVILFLIAVVFENTKNRAFALLDEKNKQIQAEKKRSEDLLLNVLPDSIAERLKKGETPIADYFEEAAIVFIDISNFTTLSGDNPPKYIVEMLNEIFTAFDKLCTKYNLEKIKTIGDCYMAVSGVPEKSADSIEKTTQFALEALETMKAYKTKDGRTINCRVGLGSGPVVAGVIGEQKFIYDLWGDSVNIAARMESTGVENFIHCSDAFKQRLEETSNMSYDFTDRGKIDVKGIGSMRTWLIGARSAARPSS